MGKYFPDWFLKEKLAADTSTWCKDYQFNNTVWYIIDRRAPVRPGDSLTVVSTLGVRYLKISPQMTFGDSDCQFKWTDQFKSMDGSWRVARHPSSPWFAEMDMDWNGYKSDQWPPIDDKLLAKRKIPMNPYYSTPLPLPP